MVPSLLFKLVYILFLLPVHATEKAYVKEYSDTGILKAEGWIQDDVKEGYWVYYYAEGTPEKKGHYHKGKKHGYWYFYSHKNQLVKEGHFNEGMRDDWWTFYENDSHLKVQYNKDKRDGFGLVYHNKKLKKALKFEEDKKVGEWSSLMSFRRDNPQVRF